uniref:Uncharacterized protein n=1 Tax=Glossina brevipalpis TaxID=37001 RepID=A0A1A9WMV6_9MUSC
MGNQVDFCDFAPMRCANLVAGITAVIGIIGSLFLLTRTTQSLVGLKAFAANIYKCFGCFSATQAFNYKIITFYHLSLAVTFKVSTQRLERKSLIEARLTLKNDFAN